MKKIIFILMVMLIACPLFADGFTEDGTDWARWDLETKTVYLAAFASGAEMTIFIFHADSYVTEKEANEVYGFIFPPNTTFDWLVNLIDEYYETEDNLSHPIPTALYVIFLNHSEKNALLSEELQQI